MHFIDSNYAFGSTPLCRTQASIVAVNNCKLKATELARALGARVGRVLAVREDARSESDALTNDVLAPESNQPITMQQRVQQSTISFSATVNVTFQLVVKNKSKKNY